MWKKTYYFYVSELQIPNLFLMVPEETVWFTPCLFSALLPLLHSNLYSFPISLAPFSFHLSCCKQQLSMQHDFKISAISPDFPDNEPTIQEANKIWSFSSLKRRGTFKFFSDIWCILSNVGKQLWQPQGCQGKNGGQGGLTGGLLFSHKK